MDRQAFLSSIAGITTDFGVEAGLADIVMDESAWAELMTNFVGGDYLDESSLCRDIVSLESPTLALKHFLPNALAIPGILHQLHNSARDLFQSLPNWEWFSVDLRALTLWLDYRGNRESFQATCLREPPGFHLRPLLDEFSSNLVEWRWGFVIQTLRDLADLEGLLVTYWDSDKLSSGQDAQHQKGIAGEQSGFGVRAVHAAAVFVRSRAHWAYLRMLLDVADILTRAQHWAEGCPCHRPADDTSISVRKRAFAKELHLEASPACPMKGRRAPEFAAGDFERLLEEAWAQQHVRMATDISGLTRSDRCKVIGDAERARHSIMFSFASKFSYMRTIPFLLAGIAHPLAEVGRQCATLSLAQFEAPPASTSRSFVACHHRLSEHILGEGSESRKELLDFVRGRCMEDCPALQAAVLSLKFLVMPERSVERLHAMGKRGTAAAPRHSEEYYSLSVRKLELQRRLDDDPRILEQMSRTQDKLRTPVAMAGALDLLGHPIIKQALLDDMLTMQLLRKVVYHCDVHTMYDDRLTTKRGLKRKAGVANPRRASLADEGDRLALADMDAGDAGGVSDVVAAVSPDPCGIVAPGSPGSPRPLCNLDPSARAAPLALLLASGASLLQTAAKAEMPSGAYITFAHDAPAKLQTLLAALRPDVNIVGADDDALLPLQGALAKFTFQSNPFLPSEVCASDDATDHHAAAFRIVHVKPFLQKRHNYGESFIPGILPSQCAVIPQRILGTSWSVLDDSEVMHLQTHNEANHIELLSLPDAIPYTTLRESLRLWSEHVGSAAMCFRRALPSALDRDLCNTMVQEMLDVGAVPKGIPMITTHGGEQDSDGGDERLACLQVLLAASIVQCLQKIWVGPLVSMSWLLTERGMKMLVPSVLIERPRMVLQWPGA